MNYFFLDLDVGACAEAHMDQHVGKMFLEACQLLCSAHLVPTHPGWAEMSVEERLRLGLLPYSRTEAQRNHPCAIWTRRSANNYFMLLAHAVALNVVYVKRFTKQHGSRAALDWLLVVGIPPGVAWFGRTALCRPMLVDEKYRTVLPELGHPLDDATVVVAYRAYYSATKRILRGKPATWTGRKPPLWFTSSPA